MCENNKYKKSYIKLIKTPLIIFSSFLTKLAEILMSRGGLEQSSNHPEMEKVKKISTDKTLSVTN